MKEATGELNMTVVTVVAIAAVGAFFYAFVWPAIQSSITLNTQCAAAYNCTGTGDMLSCFYSEKPDRSDAIPIQCPNNQTP